MRGNPKRMGGTIFTRAGVEPSRLVYLNYIYTYSVISVSPSSIASYRVCFVMFFGIKSVL